MMKRIERRNILLAGIGILLLVLLLTTVLTMPVKADSISGSCGENLTWTLNGDGLLTISGTGPMDDYGYMYDNMPWYNYRENITAAVIEQGVTSIGERAFHYCKKMAHVTLPNSITSIGPWSFTGTALTEIAIPPEVTKIENGLFAYCSNLVTITIPKGVVSIAEDAFGGCNSLKSVSLPDGVTSIGDSAFADCESLSEITIPASVISIGESGSDNVFSYCTALTKITVDKNNPSYCSDEHGALYNKDRTELITVPGSTVGLFEIAEGVQVCKSAFSGCSEVTAVIIPSTLKQVGSYGIFSGCEKLERIFISDLQAWCEIVPEEVDEWGGYWGNPLVGDCTLYLNGKELTGEVVIPEGTTRIGFASFYGCDKITSVKLPSTLKLIDECAFADCTGLTELVIPSNVEELIWQAFIGCTELKKVTFEGTVKRVPGTVFCSCENLEVVIFKGNAPVFADDAFMMNTFTAYYPYGNPSWNAQVMQNYCGTLTWIPYYPVLSGENSKVNADTEDLPIRVDADVSGFVNVLMDGQPVEPSNYTVTSGSTVVTFRAEYLRQLEVGEHTVTLVFADAQALATLTITDGIPGDMDADGAVKDADAVYLLRHTLFPESYPLNGDGDINCDGQVTDADAVYLLRHTLFPLDYPLYPGKK